MSLSGKSQSRQLAAIMFTDIVGYTALMGNDDQKAFEILAKNRALHKPVIEEFNGRWIKELGDGVMASFLTVADAVYAAKKIMEGCNRMKEFQLRIGIHLSDVLFENDDVFGDGVNLAARIQSAAAPGSIFISESVYRSVSNKKDIECLFAKEAQLKNVSHPVRMYQVLTEGGEVFVAAENSIAPVVECSIAVLPFVNMSHDVEQEYFSDGISEEIINMLAQVPEMKVIGRTSSFAFKGKNLDLKLIGEQLKVSHILEGSVRKSGNRLRITAQLIKVADGFHLYSEKFDRELEDIFAIQDEVSLAILKAVRVKLTGADREVILGRYTDNVEAYQLYLQGRFYYNKYTPDALMKAIKYFDEAIAIEPNYAIAYSGIAYCYQTLWQWNWLPMEKSLPLALESARKALELDSNIAESHIAMGRIKLHTYWKVEEANKEFRVAIAINPNNAECHVQLGMCAVLLGRDKEALEHVNLAIDLDPFSVMNIWMATVVPYVIGDMKTALENGKRIVSLDPAAFGGHWWIGLASMRLGRFEEGSEALQLAIQLEKGPLSLSTLGFVYGFMGETQKAREVIRQLESMEGIQQSGNCFIADVYLSIGEFDFAFSYYDKAVDMHEGFLLWKRYTFDDIPELKHDPRVKRLLDRIGVPY